jgi:diguanylate cyclase (GGDEF)-like protein
MQIPAQKDDIQSAVTGTLTTLDRAGFRSLSFPDALEARFEQETRKARSYRMWFEGLVAILGLNACLIVDYAIVRDIAWLSIVWHTALVTPVALLANYLVRCNPVGWLRESSVAGAMIVICCMNLIVEGNASTTATLFGAICVLISALFVGVVMRLRFPYVAVSLGLMLLASLWSLGHGRSMQLSESVMGSSMMVVGLGIILVASYSLEREERRSYLLSLQQVLQAAELALSNEALQRLSTVDKLTGLPNRRALEERFDLMWAECARTGDWLSAVVIDVDHFKMVNDVYGHLYGDETLRRIGGLLPQALRSPEDMAARFGGEEFVMLLPHAEANIAITVAERARQLVETAGTPLNSSRTAESMMWITVSCGVACCTPVEGQKWTDLVAAADEALYAAKRGGRNRVEFNNCHQSEQERKDLECATMAATLFFDKAPKRLGIRTKIS